MLYTRHCCCHRHRMNGVFCALQCTHHHLRECALLFCSCFKSFMLVVEKDFWWSWRVSIPRSGKGTLAFLPDETFHSPVFVFAILYKVTSSSFSGDIPDFFLFFLILSIFHLLLHHVISCDSGIFPPFSDLFLQIFQKTGGCTMPGPHAWDAPSPSFATLCCARKSM